MATDRTCVQSTSFHANSQLSGMHMESSASYPSQYTAFRKYGKLPIRITFPDRSAEALWLPTMLGEYYSWRRKPLEQKRSSTLT